MSRVSKIWRLESDSILGESASRREKEEDEEDELEKLRRKELRDKIAKIRKYEADLYLKEKEKELKKREEELKKADEEGEEGEGKGKKKGKEEEELGPELIPYAVQLAKLPDEERAKVIGIIRAIRSTDKDSPMAWMLPIVMGTVRANPEAPQPSLVEIAKSLTDQMVKGIELGRAISPSAPPASASYSPIELVKTFAEFVKDNVKRPLEEVAQKIQPQPSALEAILMDDKLFERAKSLGMFGGGQAHATPPDVQIELAKLKGEQERELEKLRQEHERWKAEHELEKVKWAQIGKVFDGPVGNFLATIGGATAERLRGAQARGGAAAASIPGVRVEQIQCTNERCMKLFWANVLADYAVCPFCGTILKKAAEQGGASQGGAEGEQQQQQPAEPEEQNPVGPSQPEE
jgi:hypothetical protein